MSLCMVSVNICIEDFTMTNKVYIFTTYAEQVNEFEADSETEAQDLFDEYNDNVNGGFEWDHIDIEEIELSDDE